MEKTLIIIAYLIGSILSYLYSRSSMKNNFGNWTVGDRKFGIFIALFSYIGVVAIAIVNFLDQPSKKPAKW